MNSRYPFSGNETLFVDLCESLAGYATTKQARKAFRKLNVDQRTFLEHILKRGADLAEWLSLNKVAYDEFLSSIDTNDQIAYENQHKPDRTNKRGFNCPSVEGLHPDKIRTGDIQIRLN